jgi:lipoprotein signal peptidase
VPAEARGGALLTAAEAATAPTATAAAGAARRSLAFWVTALVVLVLDLGTKKWVFERHFQLDPGAFEKVDDFNRHVVNGPLPYTYLLGGRDSNYVRLVALLNPGMMWGAFDQYPAVLKVVRPLAVFVIFLLLSSLPAGQWTSRLALGGILGGAIGNIYDSFRYPGVRDFLEVRLRGVPLCDHPAFPAFNLADSAICVGVAVLALGMMRRKE